MSNIDFKSKILDIVNRNLNLNTEFKLFIFGIHDNSDLFGRGIDIGIDAGMALDNQTLFKIQNELHCIPSDQKIYLIDFWRIGEEMRTWAENTAFRVN